MKLPSRTPPYKCSQARPVLYKLSFYIQLATRGLIYYPIRHLIIHDKLLHLMTWHQFSAKPLPEPMLTLCQLDHHEQIWWNLNKNTTFVQENALQISAIFWPFWSGLSTPITLKSDPVFKATKLFNHKSCSFWNLAGTYDKTSSRKPNRQPVSSLSWILSNCKLIAPQHIAFCSLYVFTDTQYT